MYFYTQKDDHNNIIYSSTLIAESDKFVSLAANTTDGAVEKHIPVVTKNGNEVAVVIGSVLHPMIDVHFIKAIMLETSNGVRIKVLHPNEEPKANFVLGENEKLIAVYEYCNIHGLWKIDL